MNSYNLQNIFFIFFMFYLKKKMSYKSAITDEGIRALAVDMWHNPPEAILRELEKIREKKEYNKKYNQMKKESKKKNIASAIAAAQKVADEIERRNT